MSDLHQTAKLRWLIRKKPVKVEDFLSYRKQHGGNIMEIMRILEEREAPVLQQWVSNTYGGGRWENVPIVVEEK